MTVEVLGDHVSRLAPLTDVDAREMVTGLRGSKLLTGYRGNPVVDIDGLVKILHGVSRLVEDMPEVAELDCNPVIVTQHGAVVVDSRIRVDTEGGPPLPGRHPLPALLSRLPHKQSHPSRPAHPSPGWAGRFWWRPRRRAAVWARSSGCGAPRAYPERAARFGHVQVDVAHLGRTQRGGGGRTRGGGVADQAQGVAGAGHGHLAQADAAIVGGGRCWSSTRNPSSSRPAAARSVSMTFWNTPPDRATVPSPPRSSRARPQPALMVPARALWKRAATRAGLVPASRSSGRAHQVGAQ